MGILNIILNTIPSLEQKYYDIFELGKLLGKFGRTLDLCSANLMVWSSVWAREDMTEEMYQDLFGPEGHNQIKQRVLKPQPSQPWIVIPVGDIVAS